MRRALAVIRRSIEMPEYGNWRAILLREIHIVLVFFFTRRYRSLRATMNLANRAILSHSKPARAEGDALVIRMLVEDHGAQLKRCNGKVPFDRDPGAPLPDLINHQGNIAGRPSSVGLACADFDAGKSDWLTDKLDKCGVPYYVENSVRGDHVIFPFAEHSGGDFRWEGNGGHGDVIVDKMIVMKDLAGLLAFLVKIGPKTSRANLKSLFRGMGWKPRVEKFNAEELEVTWSGVNGPLPFRGEYRFGNRMNQFNANIWYDVMSGLNPEGRMGQFLRVRRRKLEDEDKYSLQATCAFLSTLARAVQWRSSCLEAARNLAAQIPSFTPAFIRVLAAMLSFAKTTGMCWAKQANIARAAGCCDRTVRRALNLLEKHGLIIDEGYHYSGTRRFSFGLGEMSNKLFLAPVESVVSLVRSLVDVVASVVLPLTKSTPRQLALRMTDREPP